MEMDTNQKQLEMPDGLKLKNIFRKGHNND